MPQEVDPGNREEREGVREGERERERGRGREREGEGGRERGEIGRKVKKRGKKTIFGSLSSLFLLLSFSLTLSLVSPPHPGTEKFIDNLITLMDSNPAFFLSAVRCLPMAPTARAAVSSVLQSCRPKVCKGGGEGKKSKRRRDSSP